jgi:hypothetical protein
MVLARAVLDFLLWLVSVHLGLSGWRSAELLYTHGWLCWCLWAYRSFLHIIKGYDHGENGAVE